MKNYLLLRCIIFLIPFALINCSKDNDPAPKKVEIRYETRNLTGFMPEVAVLSSNPSDIKQTPLLSELPGGNESKTLIIHPLKDQQLLVLADIRLASSTNPAPSGSYLRVSLLVDGVERKSILLDDKTPVGTTYPRDAFVLEYNEL